MSVFFTSDHHFNHEKIIPYCNRPFKCIEEMNEVLIARWNDRVSCSDSVYHLGDFGLGNASLLGKLRSLLNGRIHLVLGNHDGRHTKKKWCEVVGMDGVHEQLDYEGFRLSHLPGWNLDGRPIGRVRDPRSYFVKFAQEHIPGWRICGHVHKWWLMKERNFNAGVDVHDFYPIKLDQIKKLISEKGDSND